MGSRYLTDLAAVLRSAGLNVIEEPGWQSRARGSGGYDGDRPWCVMWHHTASDTSRENDVAFICHNAEDAPLANLHLANDGTVTVCAAGATNTNGKGKTIATSKGMTPVDSMNTHAIGIEAANSGVGEHWTQAQIDSYFTVNTALTRAYGLLADDCCTHAEYAPDRKIDPATASAVQGPWKPRQINGSGTWDVTDVRSEARARSKPTPTPTPPPSEDDPVYQVITVRGHPEALGGLMDANGIIPQVTWLNPTRYEACIVAGAPILELGETDVINCDLLGPLPPSFQPGQFANVVS